MQLIAGNLIIDAAIIGIFPREMIPGFLAGGCLVAISIHHLPDHTESTIMTVGH